MASTEETYAIHGNIPSIVTRTGVIVHTHKGKGTWVIRPTNPPLRRNEIVPDILYGDVAQLTIEGEPSRNNLTYAKLDKKAKTLTVRSQSF